VGALEAALIRLLAAPPLRVDLGRAGRQRYEQSFTARHLRDGTVEVYRRLLWGRETEARE
jgi:glycosyltransferase involved in cell wall biosynthesis